MKFIFIKITVMGKALKYAKQFSNNCFTASTSKLYVFPWKVLWRTLKKQWFYLDLLVLLCLWQLEQLYFQLKKKKYFGISCRSLKLSLLLFLRKAMKTSNFSFIQSRKLLYVDLQISSY